MDTRHISSSVFATLSRLLRKSTARAAVVVAGVGALSTGPVLAAPADTFGEHARPLVQKYCGECHSTAKHKGSLDLERFGSLDDIRKDVKPWQTAAEMVEAEEMPPKGKPQPTAGERDQLVSWINRFLNEEARARAGDPGFVPTRRLSNAEYDGTIRDLTGVDLHPAQEFPADGAGGEGFTNAAESLSDVSPALLNKYLLAAKEVAAHATLLPDGFRFSGTKTVRDWSDESVAKLRAFYSQFTIDGRLPLEPYLTATLRHREELIAGRITVESAAAKEKLNPNYLRILWQTLNDNGHSLPLESIRAHWRSAAVGDAGKLAAEITRWQGQLWQVVPVGSYRAGSTSRQSAVNPIVAGPQMVRLVLTPEANNRDVTVYLSARSVLPTAGAGSVIWNNLRLEAPGKATLALRDYAKFGPAYEVDLASLFGTTSRHLAAVAEVANDPKLTIEAIAGREKLNPALLTKWVELLSLKPLDKTAADTVAAERIVQAVALETLGTTFRNEDQPVIAGWRSKDADLPALMSNSSDRDERIPGLASAHKVDVHPTPSQFAAAVWKSPLDGNIRVRGIIAHVHPNCGNGVAWWLEHRHAERAGVLAEGAIDLGKEAEIPAKDLAVTKGDLLILAIDAKNGDHSCDLTRIDFTITESGKAGRTWDLAGDVANSILKANPHPDGFGNADVWQFVKGPTRAVDAGKTSAPVIPEGSVLARWRSAALDPAQRQEASRLAEQVQALLVGSPPDDEKKPDRILYDNLTAGDGVLLGKLDLASMRAPTTRPVAYGLEASRFGVDGDGHAIDGSSIAAAVDAPIEIRLPAALARGRTFVADATLAGPHAGEGADRFSVSISPPAAEESWDGKSPLFALPDSAGSKRLIQGFDEFRQCFPLFTCYPGVVPLDEVVCLKMYHREDEPLIRLFLDDAQHRQIDRLWEEHRFLTKWPVAENKYLPLFIGFVTQDQSKELVAYFEGQRPVFAKRADDFNREWEAATPVQLQALTDFAARAYRRPLSDAERSGLLALYQSLRGKGVSHEEAFRGVLVRVLVSPAFLFRLEQAPAGKIAGPVDDWALATRLSYFLWSSLPDEELRRAAAAGQLHDPKVMSAQVQRMLKDHRVRALAVEFGTQWIHVRGFNHAVEKSEKLYPSFDSNIRGLINEESVLFFNDLFQEGRPVRSILDADYAYLNGPLATYYGIPGVSGPQWRKVDGVHKFGRGGILGMASVQATQAGASRTSPVLRGNWVVETLLGEKLPRPPPNVPRLPEEEGAGNGLTTRQLVEKHVQDESCAVCHRRMDPFGFAFERYDAIGRLRDKETSGLPIDSHAKLKDGTEFEGIDGLRNYLLTTKKDVIVRLFCRRLLGYALGRSVVLSDQPLIDEMAATMGRDDEPTSSAVLAIVRSPQFQRIRGSAFVDDE